MSTASWVPQALVLHKVKDGETSTPTLRQYSSQWQIGKLLLLRSDRKSCCLQICAMKLT